MMGNCGISWKSLRIAILFICVLLNFSKETQAECPPDFMVCDETRCIRPENLCDNILHCFDSADEYGCECSLFGGNICNQTRECYFSDQKCDGTMDCRDGSDEIDCPGTTHITEVESTTDSYETTTEIETTTSAFFSTKNVSQKNKSTNSVDTLTTTTEPSSITNTTTLSPVTITKKTLTLKQLLLTYNHTTLRVQPTASVATTVLSNSVIPPWMKKLNYHIIPDPKRIFMKPEIKLPSHNAVVLQYENNDISGNIIATNSEDCKNLVGFEGQNTFLIAKPDETKCLKCFCMNTRSACRSSPSMRRISQKNFKDVFCDEQKRSSKRHKHHKIRFRKKKKNQNRLKIPSRNKKRTYNILQEFPQFYGNQITSYGGDLVLFALDVVPHTTVTFYLEGYGLKIRRKKRRVTCPRISIPMIEGRWEISLNRSTYIKASRGHLMIVLSNIKSIKVKSALPALQKKFKIQHFSLAHAIDNSTASDELAPEVEICDCPMGYEGSSCEKCSTGYRRSVKSSTKKFSFKCLPQELPSVNTLPLTRPPLETVTNIWNNLRYVFVFNNTKELYRVSFEPFKKLVYEIYASDKSTPKYNVLEFPKIKYP